MLRVVEFAHRTDTGRQRTANEDSFFVDSPLFAVADGMGGAQAGEVASRTAVESIHPGERRDAAPETYLREIVATANGRINQLATSDSNLAGMGTTFTVALVDEDEVSIAHVGDSRAYRYRDGELTRLTSDHSLVEELRREGRLTEEQAEEHPQRSIITRALGPEPEVEIDTMTYRARAGDIYLICSDGLTTMIREPRIAEELEGDADLRATVKALVRAANEAGGRDNITVVAFRIDEATAEEVAGGETATLIGVSAEEAGLDGERIRTAAAAERSKAPRRKRRRRIIVAAVTLGVIALLAVLAVIGARQVYFLGANSEGELAMFRGLPYELPFGIELYSEESATDVALDALPDARRESAVDHELRSRDDAESLIADLERAATSEIPSTGGSGSNGSGGGGISPGGAGQDQP